MNIIRNERLEWMEEDANLFKKAWKKLVDGGWQELLLSSEQEHTQANIAQRAYCPSR
jgi:beta-mannanase